MKLIVDVFTGVKRLKPLKKFSEPLTIPLMGRTSCAEDNSKIQNLQALTNRILVSEAKADLLTTPSQYAKFDVLYVQAVCF